MLIFIRQWYFGNSNCNAFALVCECLCVYVCESICVRQLLASRHSHTLKDNGCHTDGKGSVRNLTLSYKAIKKMDEENIEKLNISFLSSDSDSSDDFSLLLDKEKVLKKEFDEDDEIIRKLVVSFDEDMELNVLENVCSSTPKPNGTYKI